MCAVISICLSISDNRVVGEITEAVACSQENMTAEMVGRSLPEAYWDLKCLKKILKVSLLGESAVIIQSTLRQLN